MVDEFTILPTELTVMLASDHAATRAGIRRALEPHRLRVIAEASDAVEAVRTALDKGPDVCLLSVELPGNGIDAARQIRQSLPSVKIVMLTDAARDEDLFGALRAGADGYLPMSTSAGRLGYAIRGVAEGEAALPRNMTARLILEFRDRGARRRFSLPTAGREAELTAREFEVIERLRRRERTAEIAARLGISEVTVRRHVSSVLHKLGASSRSSALELLEYAERQGELEPRTP